MIPTIRKVRATHDDLSQVQDNVTQAWERFRQLAGTILDGQLHVALVLSAGSNPISHGLGRAYVSAFLSPPTAGAVTMGQSPDVTKFINLVASAPCTVTAWIF